MCGLVGGLNLDGQSVDIDVIARMMLAQHHRGPNDQGMLAFSFRKGEQKTVELHQSASLIDFEGAVGFNRLSIIDTSPRGHQPMVSECGKVIIVFNGEIYNAFELRNDLVHIGHAFKSGTDTEVLLKLYLLHGLDETLKLINGMFAFCIIDLRVGEMYFARDRLGIKPFYFYQTADIFLFASEPKAFLSHPKFKNEFNIEALDEYLTFRYCTGEKHLLKNVKQLKPGHYMILSVAGHSVVRKYWEVPDTPPIALTRKLTLSHSAEALEQMLVKSIKYQMISDVKLGCQLSGGIDSSLVNLLAAKLSSKSLQSFSVTFEDKRFSEEKWIGQAAQKAEVDSHLFQISSEYFVNNLEKASWHLDQPLNHPNSMGILFLAENASKHVTVLLSGEGADELLGGYSRFLFPGAISNYPLLAKGGYLNAFLKSALRKTNNLEDPVEDFIYASAFVRREMAQQLKPDYDFSKLMHLRKEVFLQGRAESFLGNCLKYDMNTYLVDLLIRQDKMTMAASMENRVPFLDHKLVEFVREQVSLAHLIRLTPSLRPRNLVAYSTKVILKKIARRYFDSKFVFRSKMGFGFPLLSFFSHPLFREKVEDVILPSIKTRGFFDPRVVFYLWKNQNSAQNIEALWVVLALEFWLQAFGL